MSGVLDAWESIGDIREEVDALDRDIIDLLLDRRRLTDHIYLTKQENQIELLDKIRDADIVEKYQDELGQGHGKDIAEAILKMYLD